MVKLIIDPASRLVYIVLSLLISYHNGVCIYLEARINQICAKSVLNVKSDEANDGRRSTTFMTTTRTKPI